MTEEQESTLSIVITSIISMMVLLAILALVEIFPFLVMPVFILSCIGIVIFVWEILKEKKNKRNEISYE